MRFTETISTMTVKDNQTCREYKCEMGIDDDLLKLINRLDDELKTYKSANKTLKSNLDRCREKVKRQHKDLDKYYEYFTRELNWDCDRIVKEVFRW